MECWTGRCGGGDDQDWEDCSSDPRLTKMLIIFKIMEAFKEMVHGDKFW